MKTDSDKYNELFVRLKLRIKTLKSEAKMWEDELKVLKRNLQEGIPYHQFDEV